MHRATIEVMCGASAGQRCPPGRERGSRVALGTRGVYRTLSWTASLLVAFGLWAVQDITAAMPVNVAQFQGLRDVYWSSCHYFDCTCEPRTPYRRDPLELDIHADGYSLRLDRLTQIALPRRAGSIDTTSLESILTILEKRTGEDARIRIFVEAGVTMDEYIRSVDSLLSHKLDPILILQDPPDRTGIFRKMKPCSL